MSDFKDFLNEMFVNEAKAALLSNSGGGGIALKPVTNISLSKRGILSWDALDTDKIDEEIISINYIVDINGRELNTETNSVDVAALLVEGENVISVKVKAVVSLYNNETKKVVEYEIPGEPAVMLLSTVLPTARTQICAAIVNTDAYIFGGSDSNGRLRDILKFDTTTETITKLNSQLPNESGIHSSTSAALGTNIYLFGGYSSGPSADILKFDTITETIETLDTKLPSPLSSSCAATSGTSIYILGGNIVTSSYQNNIFKFDTVAETITTLDTKFPVYTYDCSATLIKNNIYILGGIFDVIDQNILKFDTVTETITTLNITLPENSSRTCSAAIGTDIYVLGGQYSSSQIHKHIYKIDTVTETITTLGITMLNEIIKSNAVSVGSSIYVFGGQTTKYSEKFDTIYKVINLF